MAWHGRGMIWHGMVCNGMVGVWDSMAWHGRGIAWHDMLGV